MLGSYKTVKMWRSRGRGTTGLLDSQPYLGFNWKELLPLLSHALPPHTQQAGDQMVECAGNAHICRAYSSSALPPPSQHHTGASHWQSLSHIQSSTYKGVWEMWLLVFSPVLWERRKEVRMDAECKQHRTQGLVALSPTRESPSFSMVCWTTVSVVSHVQLGPQCCQAISGHDRTLLTVLSNFPH